MHRRSDPAVSVLLPVRDGARHLPEAIASLEAQSLKAFEVLAVDDGSTDETPGILEAWAARDRRVTHLRQDPRGIVAALERARGRARAPYLARMDADDVALPRRLEAQLGLMESDRSVTACGTLVEYFPRERVKGGALRYEQWINGLVSGPELVRDLFVECPLPHPTFFLRAEQVEAVGGYRDAGWPEDYDLVLRLWEAGGGLAKVPEILLRWREGPDRLSRTDPRYAPEAFRRCKVHYLGRTLLQRRSGVVVWGAGPTGKRFARTLRDAGEELRAFVDLDPRKVGQEIHRVPVVAPPDVERFRDAFCVAAVGQVGARREIRRSLREMGWKEGEEFVAVA